MKYIYQYSLSMLLLLSHTCIISSDQTDTEIFAEADSCDLSSQKPHDINRRPRPKPRPKPKPKPHHKPNPHHQPQPISTPTPSNKYVIGHWGWGGLGIYITSVLNHLLYCETHNLIPVVYWERGLYNSPNGFNNRYNEWEYYFNPTSDLQYNRGDTINSYCGEKEGCGRFSYYDPSDEKRNIAYQLITKYVHLNSIVQAKVDQFYNTHIAGKKTIAIHLRGTDKVTEEKPVSSATIITEALQYADSDTQFFLATDEQRLLDEMQALLSGRTVIHYDCYRSENGKPLHTRKPKPSTAQLGEDVIVEIWLMSKCDMLIHTLSNVSSIPLYINPNLPHITLR